MFSSLGSVVIFVLVIGLVPAAVWLLTYMERSLEEQARNNHIPRDNIKTAHEEDHHNDSERMPA